MSKHYNTQPIEEIDKTASGSVQEHGRKTGNKLGKINRGFKRSFKPTAITRREYKVLPNADVRPINVDTQENTMKQNAKNRSESNRNNRQRLINNMATTRTVSRGSSRNDGLNPPSRELSATKRPKITINHQILPNGWIKGPQSVHPKTKEASNFNSTLSSGGIITQNHVPNITRKL